jgi:mRNA-degrading endonuclease toxin of MazEF toxin-antitoxin module
LESTQVLIDISTPGGRMPGLRFDSVVNCVNLATLELGLVLRKLGELPDSLMAIVNDTLEAALEIP